MRRLSAFFTVLLSTFVLCLLHQYEVLQDLQWKTPDSGGRLPLPAAVLCSQVAKTHSNNFEAHDMSFRRVNKSLPIPQSMPPEPTKTHNETLVETVMTKLAEFDSRLNVGHDKLFGHIYTNAENQQVLHYARVAAQPWVRTVCEIGFAAGHSTATFLASNPNAVVYSFDNFDPKRKDAALKAIDVLHEMFPGRLKDVRKGDSRKTVPEVAREWSQTGQRCDVLSIDGAHHDVFPWEDMANMRLLAAYPNVVLLDDCSSKDWPAVWKAYERAKKEGFMRGPSETTFANAMFRGKRKGWVTAEYMLYTAIIPHAGNPARKKNLAQIVEAHAANLQCAQILLICQGPEERVMCSGNESVLKKPIVRVLRVGPQGYLNERWNVTVHTQAVLMNDDDMTLAPQMVRDALQLWQEDPLSLVGFEPRWIAPHIYVIGAQKNNMLLPRGLVFNRLMLAEYMHPQYAVLRDYVVEQAAHCDDVLFNLIHGRAFYGHLKVMVQCMKGTPKCGVTNLADYAGGVSKTSKRVEQRVECVDWMLGILGMMNQTAMEDPAIRVVKRVAK